MRSKTPRLKVAGIKEIAALEPALFPEVQGFRVQLRDYGQMGKHVDFVDENGKRLAGFPWWDHADADIRNMTTSTIPSGSSKNPFYNGEQEWQIYIWNREDKTFVLEGGEAGTTEFASWFKVPSADYRSEWLKVIELVRASGGAYRSLDEALSTDRPVTALLLGNQRLTSIPPAIERFRELRSLDLYLNSIRQIPAFIAGMENLKWLDLRFNPLSTSALRHLRQRRPDIYISFAK
jgi:hypothetical protein